MLDEAELRKVIPGIPNRAVTGPFHRIARLQYLLDSLKNNNQLNILNAIGSVIRGGRFNLKGQFEVLYVAGDGLTANREADAIFGRRGTPVVHVGVDVDLSNVLDLTDPAVQRALGTTTKELVAPWFMIQTRGGEAPTQALGRVARDAGLEGLYCPSAQQQPDGRCLAIFPDRLRDTSSVAVTDDSRTLIPERLPKS
jgi:RES domain-containing protein